MEKKPVIATFKPNNDEGFDFYWLEYVTKDKEGYVVRNQISGEICFWIKYLNVLVDLKTKFLPSEDKLHDLFHAENAIDSDCLMFYAESLFVQNYGIFAWKDLVAIKNKIIALEQSNVQIQGLLDSIKNEHPFLYIWLNIKNFFAFRNDRRKMKRLLKEYKIIWKD